MNLFLNILQTISQILTAGIAITAFSLLIYALTFNLRDSVARSFALILVCVVVVFSGEALSSVTSTAETIGFWLRLQWVGLVFIPATYLHFSDALLATTGKPSRGRRLLVRLNYLSSFVFLLLIPTALLVGTVAQDGQGVVHLQRTSITWIFAGYYVIGVVWAWVNFWRAFRRTVTSTSQRRMRYLLAGAVAPALGSFPYLLFGSNFATSNPIVFWVIAISSNFFVFWLLVMMAYAVAFFGVSWPDRVVKRRLAKWLMRGPVTAFVVLGLTTIIRRTGQFVGTPDTVLVPVAMVITILMMEHLISLASPFWERWLFNARDRNDLRLLQNLEERLLTTGDLRQFLEAVLAAVCDKFQVTTAFVATVGSQGIESVIHIGDIEALPKDDLSQANANILQLVNAKNEHEKIFSWGSFWLLSLFNGQSDQLMGLLGVGRNPDQQMDDGSRDAFVALGNRAAMALEDRQMQQQVFTSLKNLTPQVALIQRLRAATRYDRSGLLTSLEEFPAPVDLSQSVKDALSHYWGGPKLTKSPLMRLKVVQKALREHDDNPVSALRSILRQAIERIRPEGERRFTAEWILYNILELKFMQGRKVRVIALHLAMSEADLYRKQRVAIEAVANEIIEMERKVRTDVLHNGDTELEIEKEPVMGVLE